MPSLTSHEIFRAASISIWTNPCERVDPSFSHRAARRFTEADHGSGRLLWDLQTSDMRKAQCLWLINHASVVMAWPILLLEVSHILDPRSQSALHKGLPSTVDNKRKLVAGGMTPKLPSVQPGLPRFG